VSFAVTVFPERLAEMVTVVLLAEALVEMANVAVALPAGTRTLGGAVATVLFELESAIVSPPEGAAALSLTVPVAGDPAVTVVGLTVNDESATGGGGAGGLTVSMAVRVTPPYAPEIVAAVEEATAVVPIGKAAELEPEGTVTEAGTEAAPDEDPRTTTAPPAGAGASKVAVPVAEAPPTRLEGETEIAASDTVDGAGFQPSCTTSKSLAASAAKAGFRTSLFQRTS